MRDLYEILTAEFGYTLTMVTDCQGDSWRQEPFLYEPGADLDECYSVDCSCRTEAAWPGGAERYMELPIPLGSHAERGE